MDKKRSFFLLALSALLGLGAVYANKRYASNPTTGEAIPTVPVAMAGTDLAVGDTLETRQLKIVEWPERYLPGGTFRRASELEGRILSRPLISGEPILESALLPVGSAGGLPSVIEPSQRAVSVKVDQIIGVAGFVQPGGSVDVLATLKRVEGRSALAHSRVILQNVPVLAVDQKMQHARNGEAEVVNVVTLSVNPEDAQKLVLAAHEGKLQLALRNPGDEDVIKLTSVSGSEVLGLRRQRSRGPSGTRVQILRGTNSSNKVF